MLHSQFGVTVRPADSSGEIATCQRQPRQRRRHARAQVGQIQPGERQRSLRAADLRPRHCQPALQRAGQRFRQPRLRSIDSRLCRLQLAGALATPQRVQVGLRLRQLRPRDAPFDFPVLFNQRSNMTLPLWSVMVSSGVVTKLVRDVQASHRQYYLSDCHNVVGVVSSVKS